MGINLVDIGGWGRFLGRGMNQRLEVVTCPAHQRKGAEANVAGGGWAGRGGRGMSSGNPGACGHWHLEATVRTSAFLE